jgi:LPS export ABC transporter permease LptG
MQRSAVTALRHCWLHSRSGTGTVAVMRLLDRYLLRELLVPLGYCLSGFLLLWISSDLISELGSLQEKKLHAGDIAMYYLVKTPEFIVLILPIVLLLALLYTLTNHARHNEITAIRAAGVSLWRLCVPYLLVGLAASFVLFALNELWVPQSVDAADEILARRLPIRNTTSKDKLLKWGFTNARAGRVWQMGMFDVRSGEMLNPKVFSKQPDGSHVLLSAARGIRTNGVWTFYRATEYKYPAQTNALPVLQVETNVLSCPEFSETLEEIRSEIRINSGNSLIKAKRADIPIVAIVNYLRLHPHPNQAAALYTKLQGRLAAPWTCLVVVLIAVPFGAASGRRNVFVGVASSIVICFGFFVLQQLCLALGAGGHMPSWLAGWFPNLAFGISGLFMTARVR